MDLPYIWKVKIPGLYNNYLIIKNKYKLNQKLLKKKQTKRQQRGKSTPCQPLSPKTYIIRNAQVHHSILRHVMEEIGGMRVGEPPCLPRWDLGQDLLCDLGKVPGTGGITGQYGRAPGNDAVEEGHLWKWD